jgi:hypothetical protein
MRLLEYLILAAMAGVGYAGWPLWLVLPATAAMTAAGWWRKAGLLWQQPRVPLSSKMITYFVVGIVLDLLLAAACYAAGAGVRWWMGG